MTYLCLDQASYSHIDKGNDGVEQKDTVHDFWSGQERYILNKSFLQLIRATSTKTASALARLFHPTFTNKESRQQPILTGADPNEIPKQFPQKSLQGPITLQRPLMPGILQA